MFLKSLKLKNIRSYDEEEIAFPEGITLLKGDIGSGKTSLLLAIEFALFGTSRSYLPGEALLKKGKNSAWAELNLSLEGKDIIIKRSIKKGKGGVAQESGHLIINGEKKILTPSELKAMIIELLGYPSFLVTKEKNIVYRYTVFCPQEEMKSILLSTPEERTNLLRKIFNLDKYKTIRDNCQVYLKEKEKEILSLSGQINDYQEKKKVLTEHLVSKEKTAREIEELNKKIDLEMEKINRKKNEIKLIEKEIEHLNELKKIFKTKEELKKEKRRFLAEKREKIAFIEEKTKKIPELDKKLLEEEIVKKEENYLFLAKERNLLLEKKQIALRKREELIMEIKRLKEEIKELEEKILLFKTLEKEVKKKEKTFQEKIGSEQEKEKIILLIKEWEIRTERAKKTINSLEKAEKCPLCQQALTEKHKKEVMEEENKIIKEGEENLNRLFIKRKHLADQLISLEKKINSFHEKENLLIKLETEIKEGEKNKNLLDKKEKEWNENEEGISVIDSSLESLKEEKINQEKEDLEKLRKSFNLIVERERLSEQLIDLKAEEEKLAKEINSLEKEIILLEKEISSLAKNEEKIKEEKNLLEELEKKEKSLLIEYSAFQANFQKLNEIISCLQDEINEKERIKKRIEFLSEVNGYLENFFIPLTKNIEKHLLIGVHRLFNSFIKKAFSLLISDERIEVSIDDSFTPFVSQNGYQIDYSHLSGGERTSLALAYRLALNKCINEIIKGIKTKNLLILDEPTEGFSSEQLDKVGEILRKINLKQIIIVSHESKIEGFVDQAISVTKEEGTSKIFGG